MSQHIARENNMLHAMCSCMCMHAAQMPVPPGASLPACLSSFLWWWGSGGKCLGCFLPVAACLLKELDSPPGGRHARHLFTTRCLLTCCAAQAGEGRGAGGHTGVSRAAWQACSCPVCVQGSLLQQQCSPPSRVSMSLGRHLLHSLLFPVLPLEGIMVKEKW